MPQPLGTAADFDALGESSFIALTTFRAAGARVVTTVWVARDGHGLLVLTPEESGKVKRLRHNSAVEMQQCSRSGTLADDAPVVTATAQLLPAEAVAQLTPLFRAKYGLEFRIFMLIERIIARRVKKRVIVRILPA